jgi:hypothetical protein
MTFDIGSHIAVEVHYNWKVWHEVFAVCRHCKRSTVFFVGQKNVDQPVNFDQKGSIADTGEVGRFVSLRDRVSLRPPDHVPENVARAFNEAAASMSIECFNAAGSMFRATLDLATRELLPPEDPPVLGLSSKTRRDLGLRLPWLFDAGRLPEGLRELSTCVREDGNDAAHQVNLTKEDAEDLRDFAAALLERIYTEPQKLRLAQERRNQRRAPQATPQPG